MSILSKTLTALCAVALALCASATSAQSAEAPQSEYGPKWISLFNGSDLSGWKKMGGMEATFEIEGDEIVGHTSREARQNTFLCTENVYRDFILEVDFKVGQMNSGIQLRSASRPDFADGRVYGLQVEIDPASRAWTGGIQEERRRRWLYDLRDLEEARKAFKPNDWNHFKILCAGETVKVWTNGIETANLKDPMVEPGFIALQVHTNRSETPLEVRFKNIKLLPLDMQIPEKTARVWTAAEATTQTQSRKGGEPRKRNQSKSAAENDSAE